MFLRHTRRWKDGKEHLYWSVVENRRCKGGRILQKTVLYLGEINDSQKEQWIRAIDVFDETAGEPRQLRLFSHHRPLPDCAPDGVQVRLDRMELHRPRQWGACWLFTELWKELQLDTFWRERLGASREGTDWEHVLQLLCCYRLLEPGSEWRLHRHWFDRSAMGDLLDEDFAIAAKDTLYRRHDILLEHKDDLFSFLRGRWEDLFGVEFDILLYDLTSTYFESDPPFPPDDKRKFGYSRDKRSDCVQVVIALVVTPEGFPLAYLHITLRHKLKQKAPGLTPRSVFEQLAGIQMLEVRFPTSDGRTLLFERHTTPDKTQKLLLAQLGLELPA